MKGPTRLSMSTVTSKGTHNLQREALSQRFNANSCVAPKARVERTQYIGSSTAAPPASCFAGPVANITGRHLQPSLHLGVVGPSIGYGALGHTGASIKRSTQGEGQHSCSKVGWPIAAAQRYGTWSAAAARGAVGTGARSHQRCPRHTGPTRRWQRSQSACRQR